MAPVWWVPQEEVQPEKPATLLDDALEADNVFSMLMGEDVDPRREFIQENAVYANLDY